LAYKDLGEGKGQIVVDGMDLIFFNEINLLVRQLLSKGEPMDIEETRPKRGRGRPPINRS
jgi:hypothetical protein